VWRNVSKLSKLSRPCVSDEESAALRQVAHDLPLAALVLPVLNGRGLSNIKKQTVLLMVDLHFGVIDDAGYHPVCAGLSRVCVVVYTSNGACQTHNHDSMQVHATRQGANFCH